MLVRVMVGIAGVNEAFVALVQSYTDRSPGPLYPEEASSSVNTGPVLRDIPADAGLPESPGLDNPDLSMSEFSDSD